jgi:hypothetical protein
MAVIIKVNLYFLCIQTVIILSTLVLASVPLDAKTGNKVKQNTREIRALIPKAAGIPKSLLNKDGKTFDITNINCQSCTVLLFQLRLAKDGDKDAQDEFRFIFPDDISAKDASDRMFSALKLNNENAGYVSALQSRYFTNFECKILNDTATGHIAFKIPEVFAGRVYFVAKKINSKWVITEFSFPKRNVKTCFMDSCKWKISAIKENEKDPQCKR